MNIVYPKPLKEGDRICLIDPANAFTESGIKASIDGLSAMGFDVDVSEDIGFKRGTPTARAQKLNKIFRNPEYSGVFCIWGGYGTMTLLDYLDYEAIAENRPAFVGFSDITAMHLAIQQKTGLVTFHGRTNSKDAPILETTKADLMARLMNPEGEKELVNLDGTPLEVLHPGDCSGILTGGNLSLVTRLMGTPYEIETKGKILFLEEVGEKPYCIHGMLTQLLLAGKLQEAAGILLGRFIDCDINGRPGSGFENILDVLKAVDTPVISGVQAGHMHETLTLPLGKRCRFEGGSVIL